MEDELKLLKKFESENGKCPYDEWFNKLKDMKAKALVDARLIRVRKGNFGNCRFVGEGVRELKIDYGPGYRVYFGEDGDTLIILLCGGDKSTQSRDIKKAQEYWAEYRR